jgi:hypothetical protein
MQGISRMEEWKPWGFFKVRWSQDNLVPAISPYGEEQGPVNYSLCFMSKSPITCHGKYLALYSPCLALTFSVLDSSTGKPAEGIDIRLQEFKAAQNDHSPDVFRPLARG